MDAPQLIQSMWPSLDHSERLSDRPHPHTEQLDHGDESALKATEGSKGRERAGRCSALANQMGQDQVSGYQAIGI